MSQRRGSIDDFDIGTVFRDVKQWYHIPTLVVLMGFMLWVRLQGWSEFVRDGTVVFSGNDPWYHFRSTSYVVNNWPATMPFDPWTYFPYGTSSSQFGSLFDQLVATAALIIGLGNPSDQTVAMTLLVAPAVFGTLIAIPVYFIGKRFGGRLGGIVSVLVLALSSGGFLTRSLVGTADHHVAEALFQATAVLLVMIALAVAQRERPVWELVQNGEWESLRRPLGWAGLAGVGIALYLWVWPPGVLLILILGIFFVVQLIVDYLRGDSPDHVAFVGAVSLGVAGLLMFVPLNTVELTATSYSVVQPLAAFSVAAGCVFMAWLARTWDTRDLDPRAYPVTVLGLIAGIGLLSSLVVPELFQFVADQLARIFLGSSSRAQTVGEVQGFGSIQAAIVILYRHFGLTYLFAIVGVLLLVVFQLRSRDTRAASLLLVVWAVVILFATYSEARFEYYLAAPIAVLTGYVISLVVDYLSMGDSGQEIETFQVITVVMILLLIVAPLAVSGERNPSVMAYGQNNGPSDGVVGWGNSLDWMENNTPEEGTLGSADNGMEYYGTFAREDDYDYPDGSYGVISWWDYGHWITTRGERIPTANPFQQGASEAANFLLAPNETQAEDVVGRMSEDDAEPRYVMIDWKMINPRSNGKFFAPIEFYEDANVARGDFYNPVYSQQGRPAYYLQSQRYYESMVNRLWYYHGSSRQPSPIVLDYVERTNPNNGQTFKMVPSSNDTGLQRFNSLTQAQAYVEEDDTAQIGGVGPYPSERIEALDHYRLVHNSNYTFGSGGSSTPWVKTFERVPGATIEGTGPADTNVTLAVSMQIGTSDETFSYTKQVETGPDGEFTTTVPYSTTGYDNWGPDDGYTATNVRADGPYKFATTPETNESGHRFYYNDTAAVTEGQVIGEDDTSVTVDLTREVFASPPDNETASDGEGANETTTDENVTADSTADSTQNTSSDDAIETTTPNETTADSDGEPSLAEPARFD